MSDNGITLPRRFWYPSMVCGCGECRFKNMRGKTCPAAESEDAIVLWVSEERESFDPGQAYSSYEEPDPKDEPAAVSL